LAVCETEQEFREIGRQAYGIVAIVLEPSLV
jgi:hypothetical protein